MEIKQLKYFVEVARREHISEASLELNIAQSAISRQITLLEQELQVTLFNRQGRNIHLTSHGKALFNQATQILEQLDETVALFQQTNHKNARVLNIGFEESYISQMITAIIQAFERQYDSIIVPHIMSSSDISEALYTGKIDIGLVEINAELQKNTNLSLKPLFEETYHIYVPKDDVIALSINPPLTQFAKTQLFTLKPLASTIESRLQHTLKLPVNIVGSKSLANYLLKHQRGYVILPDYLSLENDKDELCDISLGHTELKRSFCAVFKKVNKKVDILNLSNLIHQLLSKVSTYH
ncbi:LysR family transcriptional regulator [Staphylococcus haemolyticus]|uniref:glutamate biosynthesis transcriptional regulator GltC n=1 Tax=Staphylococcus haemolyticus TaxID=1283 RepID=UPI001F0B9B43|nr:LysR family transcriptional regulator [Staphylococcus haemolyticus]MCH4383388.1 LysR family transcriptional regulator [Staphylococcus haemolyticus]